MPTVAQRLIDKDFSFISNDRDKLLPALQLLFSEPDELLYWQITDRGFHIARTREDGLAFVSDGLWSHWTALHGELRHVVANLRLWFDRLSASDARKLCGSMPIEAAYRADPAISLSGYRIQLVRELDGSHAMVTVVPAWV